MKSRSPWALWLALALVMGLGDHSAQGPAAVMSFVGGLMPAYAADPAHPTAAGPDCALLTPYYSAPVPFTNHFGKYKSPLLFADGTRVQTPQDWERRRAELLDFWRRTLGDCGAAVAKPKLEILSEESREGFSQKRVRVEIAPGETVDGILLVPPGTQTRPAVVVPFYEPETSVGIRANTDCDFGYQLCRRGFVTLSIGSPGGDARQPRLRDASCQPLVYLAAVASNCRRALAQLPNVDPKRIGIVGHSYGGKWAMFAACLDAEFACGAWSDPGIVFDESRSNVNYWEPWYLGKDRGPARTAGVPSAQNPRTGPYRKLIEEGHDLHELHVLMAPRPFLVSGGAEDPVERWQALHHTVAVNQVLGVTNRVAMTLRPQHRPSPASNAVLYRFFECALR